MEKYKMRNKIMRNIAYEDSILNMQNEIGILGKRVHDIEKFLKSKPVIVENNCEKDLVEANTNSTAYTPNTKLYWNRESGTILSKAEWNKDELSQNCQLEYVGTAEDNGYEFIFESKTNEDDDIMLCFILHKMIRRSRL